MKKKMHELVPFLAIHANQYAVDHKLDGLHPTHYDLMVKYGARMESFKRATNAPIYGSDAFSSHERQTGA